VANINSDLVTLLIIFVIKGKFLQIQVLAFVTLFLCLLKIQMPKRGVVCEIFYV